MGPRKNILLLVAIAAFTLGAAATASASPAWKFSGSELSGSETLVGAATSSSMTIPGVTTECKHFLYNMAISDSGGKGKGEVTELPLFECSTKTAGCTVASIEAKKLPWPTHLASAWGNNYLIIENIDVEVLYGGSLCAYAGIPITVSGSAGGNRRKQHRKRDLRQRNDNRVRHRTVGRVLVGRMEWRVPLGSIRLAPGTVAQRFLALSQLRAEWRTARGRWSPSGVSRPRLGLVRDGSLSPSARRQLQAMRASDLLGHPPVDSSFLSNRLPTADDVADFGEDVLGPSAR